MSDEERLNLNAYLALEALPDQHLGEKALAELFLSDVEIDPAVREAIGEALLPNGRKTSGARLRLTNLQAGEFFRQVQTRRKRLKVGQNVLEHIKEGHARTEAERLAAKHHGCSVHTAKKATDFAKAFSRSVLDDAAEDQSTFSQLRHETNFVAASILKIDPNELRMANESFFENLDEKREKD